MARSKRETTATGEAIQLLMLEVIAASFLIRAIGRRVGAVTAEGGYWGVLRSLKLEGAQTVPQLARSRPVSRQHIQKLANVMISDGVIELVGNPAHKRSKLLQLTPKGESVFQEIGNRIAQEAEVFAQEMQVEEVEVSIRVIQRLCERLKSRTSR
jgi:DNA-binding MarR family transcriptional regulator